LANVRPDAIRAIGITRARAQTVINLARAFLDGHFRAQVLGRKTPELAHRLLCSIPGIGQWTASYIRMRGLGDRDVFLSTDHGVKKALAILTAPRDKLRREEVDRLADAWRPWRSYATLHLWSHLRPSKRPENGPQLDSGVSDS